MLDTPGIRTGDSEPATAANPPRQPHIAYRGGDYSSFRSKLLAILQQAFPNWKGPIGQQTARADIGVAFVEMFAYLGDIVGFYQDCRANEAFLRTAVLPASLIDLCALIDYRIPQGASAAALQSFECKPGQSGPIPAGFRVKAKSADGKQDFIFETDRALVASADRNLLRLAGWNRSSATINPPGATPVSSVLLDSGYAGLDAGSFAVFQAPDGGEHAVRLTGVVVENDLKRIRFSPDDLPAGAGLPVADLTILGKPRQTMKLAASARADELSAGSTTIDVATPGIFASDDHCLLVAPGISFPFVVKLLAGATLLTDRPLPVSVRRSEAVVYTAGHDGIAFTGGRVLPGATYLFTDPLYGAAPEPGDVLILAGSGSPETVEAVRMIAFYPSHVAYALAEPLSNSFPDGLTLFKLTLANPDSGSSGSASSAVRPSRLPADAREFVLDRTYDGLEPSQTVVISDGSNTRIAHVESVIVDAQNRTVLTIEEKLGGVYSTASTAIYGPFELSMRVNGFDRSEDSIPAGTSRLAMESAVPGLAAGDFLVLESPAGAEGLRIVAVTSAAFDIEPPLAFTHAIAGVAIGGNVAPVTLGESVVESALGSGNHAIANQTFTLQKKPLAWLHDPGGPRGAVSSLELFVDGERWTGIESLADAGPADRVYELRIAEDQTVSVVGGDGVHGARFPTGVNNISAKYRTGTGAEANVGANRIDNMPQKLPFLSATRNPLSASGGAGPETPAETRRNAPVTVRTLDRAVSVADYRDLALSYTGIAKAKADFTRESGRDLIRLVVATNGGQPLGEPLRAALAAYLDARRPPGQLFLAIQDYRPFPVRLSLEVHVLAAFSRSETQRKAAQALGNGTLDDGTPAFFHFDRHDLGESLFLSRVYAAIEAVAGVDYAVARLFHAESEPAGVADVIRVPADAVATGGDPIDHTTGVLDLKMTGGLE